jgi:hypothetical protein
MVARTWIQGAGARFAKGDMTGRAISYDPACYRLAQHFLDEHHTIPSSRNGATSWRKTSSGTSSCMRTTGR